MHKAAHKVHVPFSLGTCLVCCFATNATPGRHVLPGTIGRTPVPGRNTPEFLDVACIYLPVVE
jgi:hypothetical protein